MSRITSGAPAAPFSIDSTWGRKRLDHYQGQRLWLAFLRYAGCPLCNLRIKDCSAKIPLWQSQAKQRGNPAVNFIPVFQTPLVRLRDKLYRQTPPFPLGADPDFEAYSAYGVEVGALGMLRPAVILGMLRATANGFLPGRPDGRFGRLPADFLIDEHGRVVDLHYGRHFDDHIPFDRVEAFFLAAPP
ncbi:MAG: redoxin domain-containing protein [Myxococcota bacterium]|jgi:peroxiredoxin|nr:redoxin domain-containing protein [Myxococcota bacterium]